MNIGQNDYFPELTDGELLAEIRVDEEILRGDEQGPIDYSSEIEDDPAQEYADYMENVKLDYDLKKKTLDHRKLKKSFEERIKKERDLQGNFDGTLVLNKVRKDDLLDRTRIAKTYSSYIKKNRIRNNIAVIGGWGTGKSTFLELIKNDLNEDNNIFIINYDAASYEHEDQIWGNLYKLILEAYNCNTWLPQLRYKVKKFEYRLSSGGLEKILAVIIRIIILILLTSFVLKKGTLITKDVDLKSLIPSLIAYAAVILDILSLSFSLIEKVVTRINCVTNHIATTYKAFDCGELLGTRESVAREINLVLAAWFDFMFSTCKDGKMVVFVDELDRCSDAGIKNFFKSVHLLLDNERISFVYAIDDLRLKNALSLSDDETTRKYIEKYAQLSYCTNYHDDCTALVEHACKDTCISDDEKQEIMRCIMTASVNLSARTIVTIVSNLVLIKNKFSSLYYQKTNSTALFTEFIVFYFLLYEKKQDTICALKQAWSEAGEKGIDYYCSLYDVFSELDDCDDEYLEKYRSLTKRVIFGNAGDYLKTAIEYPI